MFRDLDWPLNTSHAGLSASAELLVGFCWSYVWWGGGNNWSYKTCKAPVKSSTKQRPVLRTGFPSCRFLGPGVADTPLPHMYNLAKYGRSKSNGTSVITESRRKIWPLASRLSRPLKVTGNDTDPSVIHDFLFHSVFRWKIAFFSNPACI